MNPMHLPSIAEVAGTFSPIEKFPNNLGLDTALGHLFTAKQKFFRAITRYSKEEAHRPQRVLFDTGQKSKHARMWFSSPTLCRGIPQPSKTGSRMAPVVLMDIN